MKKYLIQEILPGAGNISSRHQINKNKFLSVALILFVSLVFIETSCKKQSENLAPKSTEVPRKIQFLLYTNKDFSRVNDSISFTVFIQNSSNEILWDSSLMPMKVKDIPPLADKLVIEKLVPNNDSSLLKVGFRYSIKNIGSSWYLDSCNTGQTFKIVDFNFQ